jgi:hypothetical protein
VPPSTGSAGEEMKHSEEQFSSTDSVRAGLDRAQFGAKLSQGRVPLVAGFDVQHDRFVHSQTTIRSYRRLRTLLSSRTAATVGIQYDTPCRWLPPVKVTLNAPRAGEIKRSELDAIFAAFTNPELLLIEVAFDCTPKSGIDRTFVRKHALFGKSRAIGGNFYSTLHYGARRSDKFVRAYDKPELNCYRVELELHSTWLRSRGLLRPNDLCKLPHELLSHIAFVRLNIDRLDSFLGRRNGGSAGAIVEQVLARSHSLHRTMKFLRGQAGVHNAHRFLDLLDINQQIKRSLRAWSSRWRCRDAR